MTYKYDKNLEVGLNHFDALSKGSITSRLLQLSEGKTLRETAKAWGVSCTTVNLYTKKGGMPSIDKAQAICSAEGVSLQWLATGCDRVQEENKEFEENCDHEAWNKLLDIMDKSDSANLLNAVLSMGIKNMLLSEKDIKIALMVKDLPDDSIKEISILINEAQHCALIGKQFIVATDTKEIKRA